MKGQLFTVHNSELDFFLSKVVIPTVHGQVVLGISVSSIHLAMTSVRVTATMRMQSFIILFRMGERNEQLLARYCSYHNIKLLNKSNSFNWIGFVNWLFGLSLLNCLVACVQLRCTACAPSAVVGNTVCRMCGHESHQCCLQLNMEVMEEAIAFAV